MLKFLSCSAELITDKNCRNGAIENGGSGMTIFPNQISDVMYLYNRVQKLKPSTLLEQDSDSPRDTVSISEEARKKQVLSQAKSEVLERIRDAR
jgi:hypothetical protein